MSAEDVRSVLKHGHTEGDHDYRHYHPGGDVPHHHRGPGASPRWDGQRCWRHYATVDVCGCPPDPEHIDGEASGG